MKISNGAGARLVAGAAAALLLLGVASAASAGDDSALSSKPIPMKTDKELPTRTPPIIEIGPKFLGNGNLDPGITLPTGAVWQPALWVFGGYRTALQYFDDGTGKETQEWVNRLDVFTNLQFTPTERILFGVSPLNRGNKFTGYTRRGAKPDSFDSEANFDVTTLFFEGDFGEIFPNLDPGDKHSLDFGFAIGRQPLFFQQGIMINDTVDAIGITRDTNMIPGWTPDSRVTVLYGWNNVHRADNKNDNDARIFGVFTETDFRVSTVDVDFAYVTSSETNGGDVGLVGIGATQRLGLYNTSFWANMSWAPDRKSAVANNGVLLFGEISRTLPGSDDLVYVNLFWGIDNYTSAARDPTAGGPLGQMGVLYASVGLGSYGAALSNAAAEAVGTAVGYQMFFDNQRTQLVLELGGRQPTVSNRKGAIAAGARLQFAMWDRYRLQFDGFVSDQEGGHTGAGLRSEFSVQF